MKIKAAFVIGIILILISNSVAQRKQTAVSEESIKADLQMDVCKNDERLESVKKIFKKMGAAEDEIKTEKFDNVDNIVITKKGKTDEIVIVGAHYDKVADGCGAIDNWTGIVILANLYATLRDSQTDKTYIFVAFGKEEKGLIGSNAMARAIPKDKRFQYCAMINFDSFGFNYPQVLSNTSNSKMTKAAKDLAAEVKMPFSEASLEGVDADSSSFLDKDIPAITFHGLSNNWKEYLHSSKDKLENVNSQSVLVGYRFGALYLTKIGTTPCNAFRK